MSKEDYILLKVNQLLIGQTFTNTKSFNLAEIEDDALSLSKRMRYVAELKTVWWRQVHKQIFSSLRPFLSYKVSKININLKGGNVC